MPTYEYQCTKCERVFEIFHGISIKAKRSIATDCERCDNKAPVQRLIGRGAGVIFKGSGFYETDYRSESYKKAAKAEKESAKTGTDGAKSDSAKGNGAKTDKSKSDSVASKPAGSCGKSGSEKS